MCKTTNALNTREQRKEAGKVREGGEETGGRYTPNFI